MLSCIRIGGLAALAVLGIVSSACTSSSGGQASTPLGTIPEEASRNGYSSLVNAVTSAGLADTLSGEGPFTVFAPDNAAFTALGTPPEGEALASVLTYHVLPGLVNAEAAIAAAASPGSATTVNGADLLLDVVGGDLYVNEARVSPVDVEASNGIIHGLDRVLLPPQNIYDTLSTRGFTSLKGAIDGAATSPVNLVNALQGPGNFTVFAPTNAAFAALGDAGLTPADLQEVLKYHVLDSAVKASGAIAAAGSDIVTLQGDAITTSLSAGSLRINDSAVVTLFNIPATNGIIHVIDAVLIPPETSNNILDVASAQGFSSLVDAVASAGLTDTLNGEGPFTVFAPTNEAFAALDSTPDAATLAGILTYHVLAGSVDSTAAIAAASDPGSVATVEGAAVVLDVVGETLYVNEAAVGPADIIADNGIIHVIDRVLMPPESIYDTLISRGFTSLKAAIDGAASEPVDLVAALQGPGNFTVFAPTNAAFAALGDAGLTPADLQEVLKYHVLGSAVKASAAIALAGQDVETLQGDDLIPSLEAGNLVINDTATVTLFNIPATNGIIHVIDAVLMPPHSN